MFKAHARPAGVNQVSLIAVAENKWRPDPLAAQRNSRTYWFPEHGAAGFEGGCLDRQNRRICSVWRTKCCSVFPSWSSSASCVSELKVRTEEVFPVWFPVRMDSSRPPCEQEAAAWRTAATPGPASYPRTGGVAAAPRDSTARTADTVRAPLPRF